METREALSQVSLFRGADPADLDAVVAIAELSHFGPGEHIVGDGSPADAFFVVVIGTVELKAGSQEFAVTTVGSGQLLGLFAFFERGARNWSASTREATRVLRIPFDGLERLLAQRMGLAVVFYRNTAAYFAHHLRQMAAERDRPYI